MALLNRPYHWNPVGVRIADLTRTGVTIDPIFNTPINQKIRPVTYDYQAQINFGSKRQDRKWRTEEGDRPVTMAHLVMRTLDLSPNTTLPKPQKGWKIVAIYAGTDQEQAVEYVVEELRHESPLRGRPLLIYLPFRENVNRGPGG
jgi:hypothetical protein